MLFLLLVLERAFCLSVKEARAGIVVGQYGAPLDVYQWDERY